MAQFQNLWLNASENKFIRGFLDNLGILIHPFYVYSEELFDDLNPGIKKIYTEYDLGFLNCDDMKEIAAIPDRDFSENLLLKRIEEGKLCYGVKHKGKIVAFMWCDLEACNDELYQFTLRENEAYFFGAFTETLYRGKGLAPFIRYHLYKEMKKLGKTKYYSLTDYFNAPALRFKKKLKAKKCKLFVHIEIFQKYHFVILIRNYLVSLFDKKFRNITWF